MIKNVDLFKSYHGPKGVLAWIVEDHPSASLAPPCLLEVSASHRIMQNPIACSGPGFSPSAWIATMLCMDQDIPILLLVSEPQPNRTEGSREIIGHNTIYSTFLWDWSPGPSACAGIPLPARRSLLCEVLIL